MTKSKSRRKIETMNTWRFVLPSAAQDQCAHYQASVCACGYLTHRCIHTQLPQSFPTIALMMCKHILKPQTHRSPRPHCSRSLYKFHSVFILLPVLLPTRALLCRGYHGTRLSSQSCGCSIQSTCINHTLSAPASDGCFPCYRIRF